jgi:hypothetical protein
VTKPELQFLVSMMTGSSLHLSVPLRERVLILPGLLKSYMLLLAAERERTDEERQIGYESSWQGIFPTCDGVTDADGYQSDKKCRRDHLSLLVWKATLDKVFEGPVCRIW